MLSYCPGVLKQTRINMKTFSLLLLDKRCMTSVMKVCGIILLHYSPYALMTCLCCNLCALVGICLNRRVGPNDSFFFVLMCGGVINKDAMNKQTEILVQTDGMNSERCGLAAQTQRIFFFFLLASCPL